MMCTMPCQVGVSVKFLIYRLSAMLLDSQCSFFYAVGSPIDSPEYGLHYYYDLFPNILDGVD